MTEANGTADGDNAESQDGSKKTVFAAMFANLAIAVTKLVAALFTGSSSMLAEGIHSIIDTMNQVFLLIGINRSKRPPDEKHPFGYGSEVYFWSFLVAIFLFALGAGFSILEGIYKLFSSEGGVESPLIALGVLFLAFCFEGYSWTVAFKEFNERRRGRGMLRDFRDMKDPSIFVVLFEDSAACIGILIAAAGISLAWATGIHAFDAIGSILIGILLGVIAVLLAIEVKGLLIGESAEPELYDAVRERIARYDEIDGINEIRTLHLGPNDILLTVSLDFEDDVQAGRIEEIVTRLDAEIRDHQKSIRKIYVEVQSKRGHEEIRARSTPDNGEAEAEA
ncbi:cation diffusion facilitator family transporter [Palleronia aestuarii]|uniref:Cation diffusion facilitator family transporter n=1 Tax=Palleronia aestuarii TaxID=568105 RepID=A0A2W7MW08_9RHOB|nr:cation diffusion facilitator family transporter [Palleronia aestuarii]PZX11831.1 cation diffusion facilitator family transporter [Palleronia aestuarii]